MDDMREDLFSLYIHIPYCATKCPYCDFNVHVVRKVPEREYALAVIAELSFYARSEDWRERSLKSVFFGGGTPSMFPPSTIGRILEEAASLFPFVREIEITLEANPEDMKHFSGYRSFGVNRLSIGAQSFQPRLLKFLGRLHSADETRAALRAVRDAGFENLNLDLIYGSPGQSLDDLAADLREALSFEPPHLSCYNLTIEEGTPFHKRYREGEIRLLGEEEEIAMAELIEERLARAGLARYEISNHARKGFESRHNLNYWQGGDYLGIGAGAHSYKGAENSDVFGHRWQNEKNPGRYMEAVGRAGHAIVAEETSDLKQAAAESLLTGLRMVRGISVDEFSRRFGKNPAGFYPQIGDWLEEGLMEQSDGRLRLTRRGLLVADSIFVNFV